MSSKGEIETRVKNGLFHVLKKTPFEKVKVTEILKAAGISHQTFYRYYVDKYDLTLRIATEIASAFSLIYGHNATWKEIVVAILHSIKVNAIFYKRLLACPEGGDLVMKSLMLTAEHFTGGKASEAGIAGWISIFRRWSTDNFALPVEEVYEMIRRNTPVQDALSEEEIIRVMETYENRRLSFFIEKADR